MVAEYCVGLVKLTLPCSVKVVSVVSTMRRSPTEWLNEGKFESVPFVDPLPLEIAVESAQH